MVDDNPKVDVSILEQALKKQTGRDCYTNMVYRAENKTTSLLGHDMMLVTSYHKLYSYASVLQLRNFKEYIKVKPIGTKFQRMFVSFPVHKDGFSKWLQTVLWARRGTLERLIQ